jgi:hypothetical protein
MHGPGLARLEGSCNLGWLHGSSALSVVEVERTTEEELRLRPISLSEALDSFVDALAPGFGGETETAGEILTGGRSGLALGGAQ